MLSDVHKNNMFIFLKASNSKFVIIYNIIKNKYTSPDGLS